MLFILYNYKFSKVKMKNINVIVCIIYLLLLSYCSNICIENIAFPSDIVTITALGDKNELSISDEVKILNFEIEKVIYDIQYPVNGKWMLNNKSYYMWKNELDSKQPDGLTKEIMLEIQKGRNRFLLFNSDENSGLVEVSYNGVSQIIDLYNEDSNVVYFEIESTNDLEIQMIKFIRLICWYILIFIIMLITKLIIFLYQKYPKYKNILVLTIIIILQISVFIYFGYQKEGYHLDETYTYSLSNGYYQPFLNRMSDYYQNWHEDIYFYDSIMATDDDKFSYDSVYYNQTKDVHPPLYYFIIHTASSIFSNTFSKWIGIVPNILFFIISAILLFKISSYFIENQIVKFLPLVLWGFSIALISNIIYIRMYVLLTLWVLLYIYCYLKYIHNKTITKKGMIAIILATYLGVMTQYYFLIFAFFFTSIICLMKLICKKYKELFKYGISVSLGVILLFVTFPASIKHLLTSSRGEEAFDNVTDLSRIIPNFLEIWNSIVETLFGNYIGKIIVYIVLILLLISFVFTFICKINCKKRIKEDNYYIDFKLNFFPKKSFTISFNNKKVLMIVIILVSLLYMLVISLIAPYTSLRYLQCILPLFSLGFIYILYEIIKKYIKIVNSSSYIILSVVLLIVFTGFITSSVDYLYIGSEYTFAYSEENSNLNAIVIRESNYSVRQRYEELVNYNSVLIIKPDYIVDLVELVKGVEYTDKIMLYLPSSSNTELYLNQVIEELGYTNIEYLYKATGEVLYRLSR